MPFLQNSCLLIFLFSFIDFHDLVKFKGINCLLHKLISNNKNCWKNQVALCQISQKLNFQPFALIRHLSFIINSEMFMYTRQDNLHLQSLLFIQDLQTLKICCNATLR
jgi:hypothetical protein